MCTFAADRLHRGASRYKVREAEIKPNEPDRVRTRARKMKKLLALAAILPLCATALAQTYSISDLEDDGEQFSSLDSIVVSATRVDSKSPVAFSNLNREQLSKIDPSYSLPMMLSLQPSVVTTNEGGTGLGYSKMRVRGSDPTRMNVTLNGISYNDSESQEVFWVNLPSLSSMLGSAQLQRGVGGSTNGVGAFGASLNLQSALPQEFPYAQVDLAAGSYFTALAGVRAGTGISKHGFSLDVDFNYNRTDGYIRNAFARVHSFMAEGSWYGDRSQVKIVYIHGKQHTGITWNGISKEQMEADRRYNPAGEYTDADGNICYYDNESDNYKQHIIQAIYSARITDRVSANATLNYTKGAGYYEQFKEDKKLSGYGFDTDLRSNLVRLKQMDNDFYAGSANIKYESSCALAQAGLNYSIYDGKHFGTLKWVDALPELDTDRHYYDNTGLKKDFSAFLKVALYLYDGGLNLYGDVQVRNIRYNMAGYDDDFVTLDSDHPYNFVNGKAGASLRAGENGNVYASAAVAHKEPCRSDLKDAIVGGGQVLPERLLDYELGYRYSGKKLSFAANCYFMEYKNQLVATGKISESGYMIKNNVARSWRRGVELSAGWQILGNLRVDANSTFSRNKIAGENATTDLMLSPNYIGAFSATWKPIAKLDIVLSDKVVGKQYYDNLSNPDHILPAYNTLNLAASYDFGKLKIAIFANNILNAKYVADAWYDYEWDESGFFPAATASGILKLSYSF